ncbi:hypothetical protein [Bacillus sp. JCM 19034]|uniref:hypothetical protein n=1 Tax=Bacillus sp. JCM 19034 TaxID=1481928 RepID=UPI000785A69D|nr:hypothetical protein [Bacillus sp. JCM 19034]
MRKRLLLLLFSFGCFLQLVGCSQKEPSSLTIMFFSDLPSALTNPLTEYTANIYNDPSIETNIHMYLSSPEKLTVEMVAGEADIFVVEDWMYNIIFDPVILHPLDEIASKEEVNHRFYGTNELTGDKHVYALEMNSNSNLFKELNIEYSEPLIAVMMRDRELNDVGIDVLEHWYK